MILAVPLPMLSVHWKLALHTSTHLSWESVSETESRKSSVFSFRFMRHDCEDQELWSSAYDSAPRTFVLFFQIRPLNVAIGLTLIDIVPLVV